MTMKMMTREQCAHWTQYALLNDFNVSELPLGTVIWYERGTEDNDDIIQLETRQFFIQEQIDDCLLFECEYEFAMARYDELLQLEEQQS